MSTWFMNGPQGVIIIGGFDPNDENADPAFDTFLEYKDGSREWTVLENTLEFARKYHLAIPIPDELTSCSEHFIPNNTTSY